MFTYIRSVLAAFTELAAIRQSGRIWHHSINRLEPLHIIRQTWNRAKQSFCIRMCRFLINLTEISIFHHFTGIDNRHIITMLRYHTQIMGNQNHCRVVFHLQFVNHIQYLCLNGHVKSRRWLVRNQKLRVAGQCNRDHNPLFHTTGELMRIFSKPIMRNANLFQHLLRMFFCIRPAHARIVMFNHFHDLLSDRHNRIQRSHRVLKNHGNFFSTHLRKFLTVHRQNIPAVI